MRETRKNQPVRPTLEEILSTLRAHLPKLRQRHGIASIGVFGSYVRGEQRRSSDLDLLVEFERTPSLLQLSAMQREIGDLFGVSVDLVLRRTLKPAIGERILAEVVYP